jgi:hypothetical protein
MEVDFICRQTNYTSEEATAKLALHGDPIKVIQEYMGIKTPQPTVPKPYNMINEFMNFKSR